MKARTVVYIAIVAVIAGYILRTVTHSCDPPIMDTDTIYVQRTVKDEITQVHPAPVKIELANPSEKVFTTVYDPIPIPADTNAILADWNKIRAYDTIPFNDESLFLRVEQRVFRNRILDQTFSREVRGTDKIITNTVFRNGFYYGGSLSLRLNFELNLAYQRDQSIYIIGADPFNKDLSLSYLRAF